MGVQNMDNRYRDNNKMKYSQQELRKQLKKQPIQKTTLYYSLAKKDAKTLSFLSNERLLIYDDTRRILYYINEKNPPFIDKIPNPKNEVSMKLDQCIFTNPFDTTSLQVRLTEKNSKGELEVIEWLFNFQSKKLLFQWMYRLEQEKNRLVEEKTGVKDAGHVHDTLLDVVQANQHQKNQENQTILKPEEQIIKVTPPPPQPQPQEESNVRNSRLSDNNRRGNIQGTNSMILGNTQSGIRESERQPPPKVVEQTKKEPVKQYYGGGNQNVKGSSANYSNVYNSGVRGVYDNSQNSAVKPTPPPPQTSNSQLRGESNSNIRGTSNSNIRGTSNSNIRASNVNNNNNNSFGTSDAYSRPVAESRLNNSSYNRPQPQPQPQYPPPREYQRSQNNSDVNSDWNFRFLKEPTQVTIYQFEKMAQSQLKGIWNTDSSRLDEPNRVYQRNGVRITVANAFTRQAKKLKRQFRNYHFILESCKNKLILGVPLSCLIEYQGIVALFKASLAPQATQIKFPKALLQIRQLQRYTRVSNSILERASLWDLTEPYGANGDHRMIFVDDLVHYLPIHLDEQMLESSLRPQFLLDSVTQIIPGGDSKNRDRGEQKQIMAVCSSLSECIKELAQFLSNQEVLWVDALELKQIFHSYGVNFKLLHRVYDSVQNKHVRKYIQSVMAAKVAKDHINDTFLSVRLEGENMQVESIIDDYLRMLMEGNNTNSSEAWKELTLKFKRQFNSPLTNSELVPGYFLNSLIKLLRVRVDMSKFNRGKKIFKEEGIINPGFVIGIDPKVKSYYRYSTQFVEKIKYASREEKKSKDIYDEIVDTLELKSRDVPEEYKLNNNFQPIYEYLTYYSCPSEFDSSSQLKNIPIYEALLREPPSSFSLRVTKSYVEWAIKKEKNEQFKKIIEDTLKLCDFWLEDGHIYQTDLLQLLADFYSSQGNYDESVNFMKEALSKTIRTCGSQSKRAGNKYYQLGERQLKAGRKKQAFDSFGKAKSNMLANKNTSIKYPMLLMRLASLHLNSGDIEGCIEGALDSIKKFDDYDKNSGAPSMTEGYKIKTYEVLARAYQISVRRGELKDMALICARKFNKATMQWTYEQMVRICLAATIFYHPAERCQLFVGLCGRLKREDEGMDPSVALKELMQLSQSFVVMQKFMYKFDSLERLANQNSSKKNLNQDSRDFLMIARRLGAVVGDDYIEGLVQQKQYE